MLVNTRLENKRTDVIPEDSVCESLPESRDPRTVCEWIPESRDPRTVCEPVQNVELRVQRMWFVRLHMLDGVMSDSAECDATSSRLDWNRSTASRAIDQY